MLQLAGNNIIQVLDINTEEPWKGPIETLFQNHSSDIECINSNDEQIKILYPKNLHITDWTGWSRINRIIKYPLVNETWIKLSVKNSSLICTSNSIILDWADLNSKRIFHGREVWNFKSIPIDELTDSSMGRVLNFANLEQSQFFGNYMAEQIDYDHYAYYQIYTQSKFYNVNSILDASFGNGENGWK